MKTTLSFTLDTERDKDILRWYNSFPKRERSKAIRKALRESLGRNGITLTDVYEAVLDLGRNGVVAAGPGQQPPVSDEPPDVAAALDQLGV